MACLLLSAPLLALAAGCSSAESEVVSGIGFEFTLPKGWGTTSDPGGKRADELRDAITGGTGSVLLVGDSHEENGLRANVNIIVDPSIAALGPKRGAKVLRKNTIHPGPILRTTLDGEPAFGYDSGLPVLKLRQVTVVHAGKGYVITFSASGASFETELSEFQDIVESWRWNS